jgi:HprK-related kinase A
VIVGDLAAPAFCARMADRGVALRIPPVTVRVRSPLSAFAAQVHGLYRDYALVDAEVADIDIRMRRVSGIRAWRTPQVQFIVDGTTPFDPFPLAHALPMFEWGLNWVFAQRTNTHLLLHAAVVERGGRALLLPAYPGAGKSTLAASLACRHWRLLSDEFGVVKEGGRTVLPFARPPAIKNAAIDVLRSFAPEATFGHEFRQTRKGRVAHMRVPVDAVRQGDQSATIARVAFPQFRQGSALMMTRLGAADAFMKLAGHAFNYEVLGERAFRTVAAIVRSCECHMLCYGDLGAAHAALDELTSEPVRA